MPGESLTHVAADDVVQPFQIDRADVRGRLVRLGAALDGVLSGHGYPDAVAALLGELVVVAVATAGAFKFQGMLSLQTSSDGAVPLDDRRVSRGPRERRSSAPARPRAL